MWVVNVEDVEGGMFICFFGKEKKLGVERKDEKKRQGSLGEAG